MMRRFITLNSDICDRIERLLPYDFARSLLYLHELTAARSMNARPDQTVVDIGGGHFCPFGRHRREGLNATIIGLDILESQICRNEVIDAGIVADACGGLPLRDASADLVVTRTLVEHLYDNEAFFAETSRILRTGGLSIQTFPCKFAPFAVINQMLPEKIARAVLHYVFPKWRDTCGFKAYYRNCFYPRIVTVLSRNGLNVEEIHFRYYQSIYFKFFVPLYLISLLYDFVLWGLDIRILSSQILVVARKADGPPSP